jgi:histidyl-tRNA synthetase
MIYQSVKGTKDILPGESRKWIAVEAAIREAMRLHRYEEIRTPIFEETAVFARGIGEETDIVGKEMYTFTDKGGASLTLRPEMTASVIRAYIQHSLGEKSGLNKVYYIGPMFRQERPQAGRLRQFHQFGCESIGLESPRCDADVIAVAADIYRRLDIGFTLKVNSIGDPSCRPEYRRVLRSFLEGVAGKLTPDSRRRMETNPLRVLDSKAEQDREATTGAPNILDHLSDEARVHFEEVLRMLDSIGIAYEIDPRLVRGLDYYTKTAFEFIGAGLGAQDALGGGGRYDGLAEELGGVPTPAVGFAAGIERLLLVLDSKGSETPAEPPDVFFVGLDEDSRRWCFAETHECRRIGIAAECDFAARSMKAQMREANKRGSRMAVIVGADELSFAAAIVKDMSTGDQTSVAFADMLSYLKKMTKRATIIQNEA